MGKFEEALMKVIDAEQFDAVARPGCARVLLSGARVTAGQTVSGALSCAADVTMPDTDRRNETG